MKSNFVFNPNLIEINYYLPGCIYCDIDKIKRHEKYLQFMFLYIIRSPVLQLKYAGRSTDYARLKTVPLLKSGCMNFVSN